MRLLATTAIVLVLGATGAIAADAPSLPPVYEDPIGFASDWDGAYIGVGTMFETSTTVVENIYGGFVNVGANATFDSLLIGVEGYLAGWWSDATGPGGGVGAEGRIGFVADQALIYASGGLELTMGGNLYATPGAGVEFMIWDNTSLDLQYRYFWGINNAWNAHSVRASLNWHF